jgi:phosphoribosylformylglycinamidine synthase
MFLFFIFQPCSTKTQFICAPTSAPCSFAAAASASVVVVEVGPRMAFSTAWSSNAVSIAHACGLKGVTRVERSRRYQVTLQAGAQGAAAAAPSDDAAPVLSAFAALVHDRMTECVYKVGESLCRSEETSEA